MHSSTPTDKINSTPVIHSSKEPFVSDGADIIFAYLLWIVSFPLIYYFSIFSRALYFGFGAALANIAFVLLIFGYAKASKKRITGGACYLLIINMLLSLSLCIHINESIRWMIALFLRFLSLYFVSAILGGFGLSESTYGFIVDTAYTLIYAPLKYIPAWFYTLKNGLQKSKFGAALLNLVFGAVLVIPLFAIILYLLSAADPYFSDSLTDILQFIGENMVAYIFTIFASIPLCIYLFGTGYGNKYKQALQTQEHAVQQDIWNNHFRFLPLLSLYVILGSVCILYLYFVGIQCSYLVAGQLPTGYNVSDYTREGFFQLSLVCIINAFILICSKKVYKTAEPQTEPAFLKTLFLAISGTTLCIIVTALTKMWLYIRQYGLTPLRILASIFMLWLFMIFIAFIIKSFFRISMFRFAFISFTCLFTLLSLSNMDAIIARYNIYRYVHDSLDESVLDSAKVAWVSSIYSTIEQYPEKREALSAVITRLAISTYEEEEVFSPYFISDFTDMKVMFTNLEGLRISQEYASFK